PVLVRPAPINDVNGTCYKARFVGCQIDGKVGDLLWLSQPSHWLTIDEGFPDLLAIAPQRRHALDQRRRLYRTWTDRVTTDSVHDIVGGNRLRKSDNGRLCGSVGTSIRDAFDTRCDGRH